MTTRPTQPVGEPGAQTDHALTPLSARAETLRLLAKIEEHLGTLRTDAEGPTPAAPHPAFDRPTEDPTPGG